MGLSVAELEADALAVLREGPRTAAELAAVLGASDQLAHTVLGLLAVRGAIVTCGAVEGEPDALGRRPMHAIWRCARGATAEQCRTHVDRTGTSRAA